MAANEHDLKIARSWSGAIVAIIFIICAMVVGIIWTVHWYDARMVEKGYQWVPGEPYRSIRSTSGRWVKVGEDGVVQIPEAPEKPIKKSPTKKKAKWSSEQKY